MNQVRDPRVIFDCMAQLPKASWDAVESFALYVEVSRCVTRKEQVEILKGKLL